MAGTAMGDEGLWVGLQWEMKVCGWDCNGRRRFVAGTAMGDEGCVGVCVAGTAMGDEGLWVGLQWEMKVCGWDCNGR